MNNTKKYFSLVQNRIAELQRELESVRSQRSHTNQIGIIKKCQLREEFLTNKIAHLSKLTDLPMLILLTNLSDEHIQQLQDEQKIPEGEDASYLIKRLGLENLHNYVKQPKIVTTSHIKDAFIRDFDSMDEFLSMNESNLEMTNRRSELYGNGLKGNLSYLQISYDEKMLNLDAAKLDKLVAQANADFDLETLREIAAVNANPSKKLSPEFILKHSQKVLAVNPEMKKTLKKLTKKKWFGWASKWLPSKASKEEVQFMNALNTYYNNHPVANELDVPSNGLLSGSEEQLEAFVKQVQSKCKIRQNQIFARRNHINISRKAVLKQISNLDNEQKALKERFVSLMRSKTNFLPNSFQDQVWNERNLKESCMREDCYLEEKELIGELTRLLGGTELATVKQQNNEATVGKQKILVA